MTVNNFLDMLFDDDINVDVYDFKTQKTVFSGSTDETRERFGEFEVDSFDVYNEMTLCINLTVSEH